MMKKVCFALIIAMCPATLFAGETMVTQTTLPPAPTTGCYFRVDKCETSVAEDPSYVRFKDGKAPGAPVNTTAIGGDPSLYRSSFAFTDYDYVPRQQPISNLATYIQNNLSNCPEVTVAYDEDTGDITLHYLHTMCSCDCDWVVNVRNVTADDFVLKRTSDNYSPYLGQMERRKFHCLSEQGAQNIVSACEQVCKFNSWAMFK